ncbi:MAG: hemerythrin domain-containing protein [Myxococcales bacterium]|nr:hemerythrin domain-containing protein [Myxococcales bacterium]
MKPSEVRKALLIEHARLRRRARVLARLADLSLRGDARRSGRLRDAVARMAGSLERHVASEEKLLFPLLAEGGDAWMTLRIERLRRVHEVHLGALSRLKDLGRNGDAGGLAQAALPVCATVREDLEAEDRDILRPELLRDDTVVPESFGG